MSRKKATNTPPDPAPSLRPPLSPPRSSESLLPPPPLPPASLSPFVPFNIPNRITPETNNVLSDLSTDRQSSQNDMEIEPYSPRPLPEGRQIIHDDYEDVSEEIGPKSPDAVSEVDIEEELKDSDDDFILDELSDYELDVDFVKSENRSCKKELQKLLKRQKHNTNSFNDAKKDVESLKVRKLIMAVIVDVLGRIAREGTETFNICRKRSGSQYQNIFIDGKSL